MWKGITAASIWKLLTESGQSVSMIKLDPYLNVDAWTMSPYEHWEVFVTEDGWETDLDLGHYERFIDTPVHKANSITTGKIYSRVLENERKGKYLWKNIQVIPHVVNEVKEQIIDVAKNYDITIVEIWWTIWDIEWPHFIEAARQLKKDLWRENIFYAHVVPVLYLDYSWEFKTKQIQHSHAKLTSMWIQTDMLICRTDYPLPDWIKEKLSMFCNIEEDHIIENRNCDSIYEVPALFQEQHVDTIIQNHFWIGVKPASISPRNTMVKQMLTAQEVCVVWMVWKYAEQQDSYISVVESLKHAWAALKKKIVIEWIQAEDFEDQTKLEEIGKKIDWILIPWWFGSRWMEWKIAAATYARENNIPYLWLCLWLQMAVIDFARNVAGIKDAQTIEADENCAEPVISYMPWQSDEIVKWWTMRCWSYTTKLISDSKVAELYRKRVPKEITWDLITERHRHRYEVNPDYYDRLEEAWLILSWRDLELGLVEFIEIKDHKYFVATQAHPEFKSRLERPHPLFAGFVEACWE